MHRMGEKYRHLVHDAGCGCSHPDLQRASRRLEAFSRRDLLSGLAATALVGALPAQGFDVAIQGAQADPKQVRQARARHGFAPPMQVVQQVQQACGAGRHGGPGIEVAATIPAHRTR